MRCRTVIADLGAYSASWLECTDSQRLLGTIYGRPHHATHSSKVFFATAIALSLVLHVLDLCPHESWLQTLHLTSSSASQIARLQRRKLQRMEPPNGQHIWNMTTPSMKPTQADWDSLVCHLTAMCDALVETELALRDYLFALDSTERRTAEREACQWIGLAQTSARRAENGH